MVVGYQVAVTEATCRALVWKRDQDKDRATGQELFHEHHDPRFRGEVHHLSGRRVRPEWVTDPNRQVLLSVENHKLATGVWGGKLLVLLDSDDPTSPATDATKPIVFVRKERRGRELWRTIR